MSKHVRRAAAVAALTATLAGVAGLPSASAAISTQAWCANVQSGQSGFTDIGSVAIQQRRDIECLQASGITSGTTPTTYAPTGQVTRAAMATFVAKLVDLANQLETTTLAALPPTANDAFTDDEGNVHEDNINRLAAADIVQGTGGSSFSPAASVRRDQMATFLVEAVEYMLNAQLPAGSDAFTDDEASVHEANINKLAGIDVVDGVGAAAYSPGTVVSRAQMASFLIRTLAYLHSQNKIAVLTPTTQTITLTPAGSVQNETDNAAGGEVAFTASNIVVPDVDIRLFACESIAAQNPLRFVDANPNDGAADPRDDLVEADIVTVNGAGQPANTEAVGGVVVSNGTITFTVDSAVTDCVVATVWDDADDDDRVDLDSSDRPTERFGATAVQFVPPAAATGSMDENVSLNDEGANTFAGCEINEALPGAGSAPEQVSTTDCFRFTYDSNDTFTIDGVVSSLAAFEQALSTGDDVSGSYQAAAGSQSSFALTDESPVAPGNVTAAAVDGDTVNVTFGEVADAESYTIYFNADPGPLACPAFTKTGADPYIAGATVSAATDSDADTTATGQVNGLDQMTRYCFVVTAIDEGDESPPSSQGLQSAATTTDAPPRAIDAELTEDTGSPANVLTTGDALQLCFDEDIAGPVDADAEMLTLRDDDNTTVVLTQGVNAGFSIGGSANPGGTTDVAQPSGAACPTNRTLTVVLTATPTGSGGNSTVDVAGGLLITAAGEIEDTTGNQFNPALDNQDVDVDIESGQEPN